MLTVDGRSLRLQALKCRLDGGPPGNSLAALDACLDAGLDAVEADVCALADGEFLVTDGPDLARETTGQGPASAIDSGAAGGLRRLERGRGADVDAWTIDVQPGPGKRQWSVDLLRRVAALGATQLTTSTPLAWLALMEMSAL